MSKCRYGSFGFERCVVPASQMVSSKPLKEPSKAELKRSLKIAIDEKNDVLRKYRNVSDKLESMRISILVLSVALSVVVTCLVFIVEG